MNWDALGAIAELVGAIAVVGTIAYLAIQIRQNTLSNRITANQNSTDQYTAFGNMLLKDRELRAVWAKGRRAYDELVDDEIEQFYYLNLNLCWYYSSQHFQYRQGAIDEVEWEQVLGLVRSSWLESPGVRQWWHERLDKKRVNKLFVELIDSEIMKVESGT